MSILKSWDGYLWYKNDRGIKVREKNVLKTLYSLSTKNTVFVDIGAHIGFYVIRLAKVCKHVHAIEPNPEAIEILKENIKLNKIKNVTIHPYALGKEVRKANLYLADNNSTLLTRSDRNSIEVQVKTFDEVIDYCDLVKIDVEGFEEEVLLGAYRIITHVKPIWVIEHHDQGLGSIYYPETKGMSERIRTILKDYIKITFDVGRSVYIPKEKINEVKEEALKRLISLAILNKIIKNLEEQRPWYYGMPYTWWYSMTLLDFYEELLERVLNEPEWLRISE